MIVFVPTSSGAWHDQTEVPEASPELPYESFHFTEAIPAPADAVPLNGKLARVVETIVAPG